MAAVVDSCNKCDIPSRSIQEKDQVLTKICFEKEEPHIIHIFNQHVCLLVLMTHTHQAHTVKLKEGFGNGEKGSYLEK